MAAFDHVAGHGSLRLLACKQVPSILWYKTHPIPKHKCFSSRLCPIHWSQVLSWEWRCSWSSADRHCSNYIWVINNFIAYWGASYIRDFTVLYWVNLWCNRNHSTARITFVSVSIKLSPKFNPNGPCDKQSALFQVMATFFIGNI